MEELGVKKIVEEKIVEQKTPVFLTGLMTIILIAVYTFTLKSYEPAASLIVTGGIIVYPFTFLITALIFRNYGFKETRKSIFISSLLYVIFFVLMIMCVSPHGNNITSGYNAVVQYLFTNNFFEIGETRIFYPTLGQFFSVVVAFVVSHLLFAVIYNAIHKFTVDYLAVGLSVFIAYVVDRLLFMPILFAKGLSNGSNTFDYFIRCLTSEFIIAILCSILIVVLYVIITSIKKLVKKKA